MNKDIKILLADDHPIFREGLIRILQNESDFKIIAAAGDGDEAISLIRLKKPDIAILDISMPGLSGIDIAAKIREEELPTLAVILTMYSEQEYLANALEQGVCGYLLKEHTTREIIDCIRTVMKGGYYISKQLSQFLIKGRNSNINSSDTVAELLSRLTPTEKLILKMISENKTSVQIAKEMFVSFRTVQNHRLNISNKLGLHGHNKLLFFALENKKELSN